MYGLFYLILLFYKVFIGSIKSFFSYHKVSKQEKGTTIQLKWKTKKLQLNFKEFAKGFDEATVKNLKEKCKLLTDVPIASMKLQVSGGNVLPITFLICSSILTFKISQYERRYCYLDKRWCSY